MLLGPRCESPSGVVLDTEKTQSQCVPIGLWQNIISSFNYIWQGLELQSKHLAGKDRQSIMVYDISLTKCVGGKLVTTFIVPNAS